MKALVSFVKREIVLSISVILAVISMFWVHPDQKYLAYIDGRTLIILFCMMAIVAGIRKLGVFDLLAEYLLRKANGTRAVISILVLLCFFLSMLITNDVALITFVPFSFVILKQAEITERKVWIKIVVMQTIAANLGSMLTPVGNPQNLYLFGKSSMCIGQFILMMLPYSAISLILLLLWIWIPSTGQTSLSVDAGVKKADARPVDKGMLAVYLVLLILSLGVVARILPVYILLALVLLFTLCKDKKVLTQVDYSLLGIFLALFIFIGNLGRIEAFRQLLESVIDNREVITAVAASQVMSNVPAALLLSGFTERIDLLIIGANLGGLGTLIASMASLISFKYIAREDNHMSGRYLVYFTAANLVFLICLLLFFVCGGGIVQA